MMMMVVMEMVVVVLVVTYNLYRLTIISKTTLKVLPILSSHGVFNQT